VNVLAKVTIINAFSYPSNIFVIKIWSNILRSNGESCEDPPTLVSAFSSVPMEPGHFSTSGLVLEWQPYSGTLLAAGNSRSIRCWDLVAEMITNKFATNSSECVTTMTTAWHYDSLGQGPAPRGNPGISRDTVVAGFSDGTLKIFDIRTNSAVSEVSGHKRQKHRPLAYNEHKSWVVNAAFTGYSDRYELLTGTLAGEVKFWDLRMSSSVRTVDVQRSTMTTIAVHPKIPMMATGSHAQFIKILTLDGDTMQVIRYHEKIANHRIEPVSCVTFHPNKPLLATGGTDTYIGLYTTKRQCY
jgi:regulatory associated protein of mTOR